MDRSELIARAAPTCHECTDPVGRVEMSWRLTGDGWRPGPTFMVCTGGHRVPVEPLPWSIPGMM